MIKLLACFEPFRSSGHFLQAQGGGDSACAVLSSKAAKGADLSPAAALLYARHGTTDFLQELCRAMAPAETSEKAPVSQAAKAPPSIAERTEPPIDTENQAALLAKRGGAEAVTERAPEKSSYQASDLLEDSCTAFVSSAQVTEKPAASSNRDKAAEREQEASDQPSDFLQELCASATGATGRQNTAKAVKGSASLSDLRQVVYGAQYVAEEDAVAQGVPEAAPQPPANDLLSELLHDSLAQQETAGAEKGSGSPSDLLQELCAAEAADKVLAAQRPLPSGAKGSVGRSECELLWEELCELDKVTVSAGAIPANIGEGAKFAPATDTGKKAGSSGDVADSLVSGSWEDVSAEVRSKPH